MWDYMRGRPIQNQNYDFIVFKEVYPERFESISHFSTVTVWEILINNIILFSISIIIFK